MPKDLCDIELVAKIATYPILYDNKFTHNGPRFKEKARSWREVSAHMNASETVCITRWKSIRDRFGKENRRLKENPLQKITWKLYPHLKFLKSHYKTGFASNNKLWNVSEKLPDPQTKQLGSYRRHHSESDGEEASARDIERDEHFDRKLIQLVKQKQVLYDRLKIRVAENIAEKRLAWKKIAQEMNAPEESCYLRWKLLRRNFAREYQKHLVYPKITISWTLFEDLLFLEDHYRKGVPLDICKLKRLPKLKPSQSKRSTHLDASDESECFEQISYSKEDLGNFMQVPQSSCFNASLLTTDQQSANFGDGSAEQMRCIVIKMETMLQQAQNCLQKMVEEQKKHDIEIQNKVFKTSGESQPGLQAKMQVLLEGLGDENRELAQKKIVQFLCECQIKILNNQDIDDIISTMTH